MPPLDEVRLPVASLRQGRRRNVRNWLPGDAALHRGARIGPQHDGKGGRLTLSSLLFGDGPRHLSTVLSQNCYQASNDAKILAQIDAPNRFVAYDFIGGAGHENFAVMQNVGAIDDFQRLADIVIRDQNAKAA